MLTKVFSLDGFFDSGMLLSSLKGDREDDSPLKASHRRNIGRRLRMAEY